MVWCRGDTQMAGATKVVLDASAVVKWYNEEDYSKNALLTRDDYISGKVDLVEPYLLIYEVGNALRYNAEFGQSDVESATRNLLDMQMDLREISAEQIPAVLTFAYTYGITFYDAAYVALSNYEDIKFYTADDKLLAKVDKYAIHIKEYV